MSGQPSGTAPTRLAAARSAALAAGGIDVAVMDALIELEESVQPGLLREVFTAFLGSADQRLAQAAAALAAQQAHGLRSAAHAMKSAAANVGALALSRYYTELERCGHEGQLARGSECLAQVQHEQARVTAALNHILQVLA